MTHPPFALVRGVPMSFAHALSGAPPEPPIDVARAQKQHAAYVAALASLGLEIVAIPADEACPDCCFVEDTLVTAGGRAVLTRPGAVSRRGEVEPVARALAARVELIRMAAPATLDGGDCLRVGRTIYVGRSSRSNEAGIACLREGLRSDGAGRGGRPAHVRARGAARFPRRSRRHLRAAQGGRSAVVPLGDRAARLSCADSGGCESLQARLLGDRRQGMAVCRLLPPVLVLALGCARAPVSLPPLDPAHLHAIEQRGQQIYQLDRAAARATDVALPAGLADLDVDGWIVVRSDAGLVVRFVGACPEGACSLMDVDVPGGETPRVALRGRPPQPLTGEQAAMWRARQMAASTSFVACTPGYNTVVLPREGDEPWTVYLLAATADPGLVVLTGHHRVTVTPDGRAILRNESLARECVVSRRPLDVPGFMLTDDLHAEPSETHVFASLLYAIPLRVRTARGEFRVEGAKIELVTPD